MTRKFSARNTNLPNETRSHAPYFSDVSAASVKRLSSPAAPTHTRALLSEGYTRIYTTRMKALMSVLWVLSTIFFVMKIWYQRISTRWCRSKRRMDGKTVIVTGANTGIGKETARDLAARGAKVILACRDMDRGNKAMRDINNTTGSKRVKVMHLDLGSISSVRSFIRAFTQKETRLDVLINNAAAVNLPNEKSMDGLQQEMQTNQFGPFLLTVLLIGIMKKTAQSRVVVVSSRAHANGNIDLDNLQCEKKYPGFMQHYSNAKLANVLFSNELARRLESTGITCNSLHPGLVKTDIARNFPRIMNVVLGPIFAFFIKNTKQGAQTTIHCAVSEELDGVTGKYFVDCKEAAMSDDAQNQELAKELWDECVKVTKISSAELREIEEK